MPIIDQVRAQQQQPQGPAQAPPAGAPPQPGGDLSEAQKDVVIAVYGMLYDKRTAVGEKLAQQIQSSRDPVAIIANSAHDIVAKAVEATGVQLQPDEFKAVAAMALERIAEIAEAVGVELSEEDGAAAGEMMSERAAGGQAQPGAEPGQAPPQQPQPGVPA